MDQFLKAHTIKETSKLTGVAEGTIRQWEKDLEGVLVIPRDENNYRYYTELEIETLERIKLLREKDLSIKTIREILSNKPEEENSPAIVQPSLPAMKQNEVVQTLRDIQNTLETLPEVRELIVSQIREDIKKEIQEEIQKQTAAALEMTTQPLLNEIRELSKNQKREVSRRDKLITDNMKLMRELKEEKSKGIFKRLFQKD